MDWITLLAICIIVIPFHILMYIWTYALIVMLPRGLSTSCKKNEREFVENVVMNIDRVFSQSQYNTEECVEFILKIPFVKSLLSSIIIPVSR